MSVDTHMHLLEHKEKITKKNKLLKNQVATVCILFDLYGYKQPFENRVN